MPNVIFPLAKLFSSSFDFMKIKGDLLGEIRSSAWLQLLKPLCRPDLTFLAMFTVTQSVKGKKVCRHATHVIYRILMAALCELLS